jgi:hypothetical protein
MKNITKYLLVLLLIMLLSSTDSGIPNELSIVFRVHNVSAAGGSDGEIHALVTGGVSPYDIYRSTGEGSYSLPGSCEYITDINRIGQLGPAQVSELAKPRCG